MWQALVTDTSFWTTYYFIAAATLNAVVGPWVTISAAYLYSSLELVVASAVHTPLNPALTWFAHKVAVLLGVSVGHIMLPKVNPWFLVALAPGLTLYLDEQAKYGVAALYILAATYNKMYKWALYILCITTSCIVLTEFEQRAPLLGITTPVIFLFLYHVKYDAVPEPEAPKIAQTI